MAQFGAFCPHGESFVPFSPPRSQAGRVLYRMRGRVGASHDSTPRPTSVEDTDGPGGRRWAWLRRPWAEAGPGRPSRRSTSTRQHSGHHWCGERDRAWLRRPWAAARPGRASRRRAERSSRRGRRAGGPPPTGAPSSPARQRIQKRPPGTGWAYLSRLWESNPRPIHYE